MTFTTTATPGRPAERWDAERLQEPVSFWARVSPRSPAAAIEWSEWLTPYSAENLLEEARRAGRGARVELHVRSASGDGIRSLSRALGKLEGCEIVVVSGRDRRGGVLQL